MAQLFGIDLVPASVHVGESFRDAAEELVKQRFATIAVLDSKQQVVGLFGGKRLLHGLFPQYLGELHHTAFASDDLGILKRCASETASEPIEEHMRPPVHVDLDTSATHVAELFLHHDFDAIPVCDDGEFVGMLGRSEFCRTVLRLEDEPALLEQDGTS